MQEISNIPPNTVIPCCKIVDSLILLIKENIGPSISKFINTVELLPQPRYSLRTKLLYYLAVPIPYFTVTVISSDQYAIILLTAPIVIHWLSEDCSHWYIVYLFPPLVATTGIFQKAQEKKNALLSNTIIICAWSSACKLCVQGACRNYVKWWMTYVHRWGWTHHLYQLRSKMKNKIRNVQK